MTEPADIIDSMLSAWNSRDDEALARIVAASLTSDVEFCDPPHDIRGHDAFIAMVKRFWADNGECTIRRASKTDCHHDRARYHWSIDFPDGRRFDGMDAVALDLAAGKVRRIDGFFGPLARDR
jgi:hypothetical protein